MVTIFIISVTIVFCCYHYVALAGRGVPAKNDLYYTTGIVKSTTVFTDRKGRTEQHIQVYDSYLRQTLLIGCGNRVYPKYKSTSCYLDDYDGKVATIGWYYVPDFWWFHNDVPQLMTFESGGVEIRTYDKRIEDMKDLNIFRMFVCAIISLIFLFVAFK